MVLGQEGGGLTERKIALGCVIKSGAPDELRVPAESEL
jgi:hypothetical protein